MDFMNRGGALMWVLLAFSFVALAVTIERILTYASYGYSPDRWLRSLLQTIRTSDLPPPCHWLLPVVTPSQGLFKRI